jgi:hypothetical protein
MALGRAVRPRRQAGLSTATRLTRRSAPPICFLSQKLCGDAPNCIPNPSDQTMIFIYHQNQGPETVRGKTVLTSNFFHSAWLSQ